MQFVGQITPGAGNTHTNFTFTTSEHTHRRRHTYKLCKPRKLVTF